MIHKKNVLQLILGTIQSSPQECTIRSLHEKTRISRNTLAKYLDILTERGEIEMKMVGTTKKYSISERVPDSFLLKVAMDPACTITGTSQIEAYNPLFFEFFMNRSDRWRGREISSLLPEFGSSSLQKHLEIAKGGQVTEKEQEILCSGKRYIFRLKLYPLLFQDGRFGIGILFRDETGTQRLNQALQKYEMKYQAIVEDQLDLVCRRMPDLKLSFVNRAYGEAARRTADDLLGERTFPFAFSKSIQGTEMIYAQISEENPVISAETKDMRHNGLIICYQWMIRGFFAANGEPTGYQAIGRDITELKKIQEQLVIYQKTLESLSANCSRIQERNS